MLSLARPANLILALALPKMASGTPSYPEHHESKNRWVVDHRFVIGVRRTAGRLPPAGRWRIGQHDVGEQQRLVGRASHDQRLHDQRLGGVGSGRLDGERRWSDVRSGRRRR
jgi:hypothetical protein